MSELSLLAIIFANIGTVSHRAKVLVRTNAFKLLIGKEK